jgi:hypothetical protein
MATTPLQKFVWFLILLLVVLHQDNWFWDDTRLVLGFMPIGLFYHAFLSLAAATVWYMAVKFCWPAEVAGSQEQGAGSQTSDSSLPAPRSPLPTEGDPT